jgi:hypothetical protein
MNALTTWTRRGALLPVLAVASVALLAGCHGSGVAAGGGSGPGTSPAAATAPASAAASGPASAPPTAARVVYLATSGSVTGTPLHEPACSADCLLSGDSTLSLHAMTWQSWGATQATGTGDVRLVNCTPNCASGKSYLVPATVTLSRPVLACVGGAGKWYWTRTSFTWTKGLPALFSGDNAPANPFDYVGLASQSAKSC